MAENLSNIKNNLFPLLPYFLQEIIRKILTIFQYFVIQAFHLFVSINWIRNGQINYSV